MTIGTSPLVRYSLKVVDDVDVESRSHADMELTITNASPQSASVEIMIGRNDRERLIKVSSKLGRKAGKDFWKVSVPANGERVLKYRLKRR